MAKDIDIEVNTKPLKNNRHERFALAIVKGMSQQDAAIEAGYKLPWARKTASRLRTKEDILRRVKQLQEMAKGCGIMTVKERKRRLSEIASEDNEGKAGYQRQPNISAIAELNKMEGEYKPSKVELAGKVEIEWLYKDRGKNGS